VPTQSNQASEATAGSQLTLTCAFPSNVTAGVPLAVVIQTESFVTITVSSVTDNAGGGAGDTFTEQQYWSQSSGTGQNVWLYTATKAIGGATTVSVTISNYSYDVPFMIFILAGPSEASAVRVSNQNNGNGVAGTTTATASLTGTVSGDYVVAFATGNGAASSNFVAPTAGLVGTNAATSEQTYINGTNLCDILEDGTSSGGTVSVTASITQDPDVWAMLAVAFVPGSTSFDAVGFGAEV
jgi:hypothetical protein